MAKLFLGIIIVLNSSIIHAQIYQWIDEHGNAQFSDEPPKQGTFKTLDISTTPRSSSTPSLNNDDIKLRKQKQIQVFEQERLEKNQKQRELAQKQQELHNECLRATDYLDTIQTAKVYDLNNKGERIYKSEQQRVDEIKRVERAIKLYCSTN